MTGRREPRYLAGFVSSGFVPDGYVFGGVESVRHNTLSGFGGLAGCFGFTMAGWGGIMLGNPCSNVDSDE